MPDDRPVIVVDPAVRFGRPHIRGVTTETIADLIHAGETVAAVAEEYGLTRHEVLLACWWEATGGRRRVWRRWAEQVAPALGGWVRPFDVDALPDPPDCEPADRGR